MKMAILLIVASAWRETKRRRRRSVLTVFGYAATACMLMLTISLLLAAREKAAQTLRTTGAQFVAFIVDRNAASEGWREPASSGFYVHNNPTRLFPASLVQELRKSPYVRQAAPILLIHIRDSDRPRALRIAGFDASDMESVRCVSCSASEIVDGTALAPGNTGSSLLEQTFAVGENLRPGDTLSVAGRVMRVTGIIGPGTRPVKADIYVPIADAVEIANTQLKRHLANEVNAVLIDGTDSRTHERTIAEATRILGPDSSAVGYGCWKPAGAAVDIGLKGMGGLALLLAAFCAVWTIISQVNSVNERRRDIAVLKAIGWSSRTVVAHIALEVLMLAALGGIIGTIAAALLLTSPPSVRELTPGGPEPYPFHLGVPLFGLAATVLLGIASAMLLSRLITNVRPADTLRRA